MDNHPKVRSPTQAYFFHLVSYLDEQTIGLAILSLNVRHFAYILHDKDRYTEGDNVGELKEPHYHILLAMVDKQSLSTVLRPFKGHRDKDGIFINTFGRGCTDRFYEFDYLDHSREDCVVRGDYLYSKKDIKTDCMSYWASNRFANLDKLTECFIEFYQGVPYFTLLLKYGKMFVMNYSKLEELAYDMARNEKFDPDNYSINKPNEYNFLE